MGWLKKNLLYLTSLIVIILVVTMGYYNLSLGLTGRIDWGENVRLSKLIWFFGSILLISSKAILIKYDEDDSFRNAKFKLGAFAVTFAVIFISFTVSGGVTFDASNNYALGYNVVAIAKAVFIGVIIAVAIVALILILFANTPTEYAKTAIKMGTIIAVVIACAYTVTYVL